MIQPSPKIAMGEQIHPQQGQKVPFKKGFVEFSGSRFPWFRIGYSRVIAMRHAASGQPLSVKAVKFLS